MYSSVSISNFRSLRKLNLSELERFNLIAGVNNVGKTTLLEALFLHCGAYNPGLSMNINAFRGIENIKIEFGQWKETPWDSLFTNFDTLKSIEISGDNEITGQRTLRLKVVRNPDELEQVGQSIRRQTTKVDNTQISLEAIQVLELAYQSKDRDGKYYMVLDPQNIRTVPIPPAPPFPAFFLAARTRIPLVEDAERFGKLELIGKQGALLKALQIMDNRLQRLAVVVSNGIPMIHGDIGLGRLVPLPVMGEGMVRLASLVLAIGNAPDGVVLVDEIENGLHYSLLVKIWKAIAEVAREFNAQIFATTHSIESVIAAQKAFSKTTPYDFQLLRLERRGDANEAVSYDQESLSSAIEMGLEVR